jgi:hypothetical protein
MDEYEMSSKLLDEKIPWGVKFHYFSNDMYKKKVHRIDYDNTSKFYLDYIQIS